MSAAAETFGHVLSLLREVPGLRVLDSDLVGDEARFKIEVSGAHAIESLQHLALSANLSVHPWLRSPLSGSVVQQTLVARTRRRDTLECGELQIFGIHLVWHLHKDGLMVATAANGLLRKWHAAEVEA